MQIRNQAEFYARIEDERRSKKNVKFSKKLFFEIGHIKTAFRDCRFDLSFRWSRLLFIPLQSIFDAKKITSSKSFWLIYNSKLLITTSSGFRKKNTGRVIVYTHLKKMPQQPNGTNIA